MEVISLQSGSSGNCVFVRSGGTSVLFDAGISGCKAETRLAKYGHNIRDCCALVISHEHSDHICGAGVFHRKYNLPVFSNVRTWNAMREKSSSGCLGSPNHFATGEAFELGSLRIEPIRTPHDAIEGVCFVIEDVNDGQRFGLLTDLGHAFTGLSNVIRTLDAVLLESNYDEAMLHHGPYPQHLKNRIAGKRGHLSNTDAAKLLDHCDTDRLQWVCLGHLSGENNTPEVAISTHRKRHGSRFSLFCADRDGSLKLPRISQHVFSLRS